MGDVFLPEDDVPGSHADHEEKEGCNKPASQLKLFAGTLFVLEDNYMVFSEKHTLSSRKLKVLQEITPIF